MIIISEVAKTLEDILNEYPTDYQFKVATQGFHLEKIADEKTGKNFIPVFISFAGGQINPVPNLKQASYNIRVQMFFPIRFKEDIFALCDKIYDSFVGVEREYGSISGTALSNISIPSFGEIQNFDFTEFREWVGNTYQKTLDVMEAYMSMDFDLYLSTLGNKLAFGNSASVTLTANINGVDYTDNNPIFDESSIQSNSEGDGQQVLDDNISSEIESGIQTTSYGSGFTLYLKDEEFYLKLIESYFAGEIQKVTFTVTFTIFGKQYARNCYVKSTNLMFSKGQPISMVLSFAKKVEIE